MSDASTAAPSATSNTSEKIERRVRDVLSSAGVKVADLTEEQRARALEAPEKKGGLRGKALATWVLEGKTSDVVVKEARKAKNSGPREPRKSTRYAEWVGDAVHRGRLLTVQKDPEKHARGEHIGYTGPIQHIKVRKNLERKAGGDPKIWDIGGDPSQTKVTTDQVVEASGVSSFKALREIATFKSDKASMRPLRELSKEFEDDGWAKGRFLAAILTVFYEDLKKKS